MCGFWGLNPGHCESFTRAKQTCKANYKQPLAAINPRTKVTKRPDSCLFEIDNISNTL